MILGPIMWVIIGLIAGWAAGKIMKGSGYGTAMDIVLGIVGAIVGGMTSYPFAALGALGVGVLESFASFQSSALKDVIVFSLLIPILLWRSIASQHSEEEVEE